MFEHQTCCECGKDLWYSEIGDYLGVELQNVGIICKSCERRGVESGEYVLKNIQPPQNLTFVLKALPHTKTKQSRSITCSWEEVVETVGPEKNRFDISIVEGNLDCHGNYIRKSLLRGEPSREKDFIMDESFLEAAYKDQIFDLRIYCNRKDKEGTHLYWKKRPSFAEYEDRIKDVAIPMMRRGNQTIFISTRLEESAVVPKEALKSFYYYPTQALKWMGSLEEAERAWKDLDVIKPEQYKLVERNVKKMKKRKLIL